MAHERTGKAMAKKNCDACGKRVEMREDDFVCVPCKQPKLRRPKDLYEKVLETLETRCSSKAMDDETDREDTAEAICSTIAGVFSVPNLDSVSYSELEKLAVDAERIAQYIENARAARYARERGEVSKALTFEQVNDNLYTLLLRGGVEVW